jgi:hypothetical protein
MKEQELYNQPHLLFNTGCRYTEHGQRILALQLGNDVLCHDYDRSISYFFKDCPLDARKIEAREKASGSHTSIYDFKEDIILWRVWDHWAEKLNLEF